MQYIQKQQLTLSVVALLWLTGQRDLFKFGQDLSIALSLLYALCLIWILGERPTWWQKIRHQSWLIPLLFVSIFLFAAVVIYPYADNLKFSFRGSDRDDAVMAGCQALLNGDFPYLKQTYLGNPVSSGPGVLLLFLPSALTGWYPLATLLGIGLTCMLIGRWRNRQTAIDFLAYLSLSVLVWHHIAVGSDLIVVGLLVLITTELSAQAQTRNQAIIVGALAGILGSTRIVFAFLPLMYGFIIGQRCYRKGLLSGTIGTLSCVGLHGIFLIWDGANYTPLHLMGKGAAILDGQWTLLSLICSLFGAFYLLRIRSKEPQYAYRVTAVTLSITLGLVSAASFPLTGSNQLSTWQGVSYLMPILPTFIYFWIRTDAPKPTVPIQIDFQIPDGTLQRQP